MASWYLITRPVMKITSHDRKHVSELLLLLLLLLFLAFCVLGDRRANSKDRTPRYSTLYSWPPKVDS